jgi:N4-gp56 family major capsid protein
MPGGQGPLYRWTRWAKVGPKTTPLSEGVNPTQTAVSSSNVDVTLLQYGDFARVTDRFNYHSISRPIADLSERFGRGAADTVESLIIAEVDAGAAIQYVANRANDNAITAPDVLDHKELIEATVSQKLDFIGPHESGRYVAVLNPAAELDLKSDQQVGAWVDIHKQSAGAKQLMRGQFGEMYGMPLLVSDRMTAAVNGSAINVRKNYVIGEEAFGTVDLQGKQLVQMMIKNESSGGTSNPLDMFGTVGYKIKGYATKYLDSGSKRVIQIRGASAIDL